MLFIVCNTHGFVLRVATRIFVPWDDYGEIDGNLIYYAYGAVK